MVGKLQAEEEPGLLLVDADRREPTLTAAVAVRTTRGQAVPPGPERGYLWHEQDRPNDLVAQRWGVIAPEGPEGDELLAAIEPLIRARGEQQQAAVKVYRVPAQMSPATAASWKREVFHRSERLRQDLPRYQLLLGDLHQVPETLQISQATDGFVGRLAFDAVADYADYCAKILAAEAAPAPGSRQALFHGVADGTAATEAGIRGLVRPCVALAREMQSREAGLFPATIVASEDAEPDPASFRGAAGAAQVLLSLSHGEGAPRGGWRSPAEQRARQGAMSFGRDADDLAGEALLRGPIAPLGLWLMFACFSAGTPSTSKYARWIERLIAEGRAGGRPEQVLQCLPGPGEPPFVAAIPKAALRNPQGPLAFIGHVDLAWSYSFREVDGGRPRFQPGRFLDTLAAALQGDRVGVAFRHLFRWFEQVNTELTTLDEEAEDQALRRAQLWMLRQDLAGFMLLGDPAARLPGAAKPAVTASPVPVQARDFFAGMVVMPTASAGPASGPTIDRLEQAIGLVLAGSQTPQRAAQGLGISAAELAQLVETYRRAGRSAIGRG